MLVITVMWSIMDQLQAQIFNHCTTWPQAFQSFISHAELEFLPHIAEKIFT